MKHLFIPDHFFLFLPTFPLFRALGHESSLYLGTVKEPAPMGTLCRWTQLIAEFSIRRALHVRRIAFKEESRDSSIGDIPLTYLFKFQGE